MRRMNVTCSIMGLAAIVTCGPGARAQAQAEEKPHARPIKIPIRFARASEVAVTLGGDVILDTRHVMSPPFRPASSQGTQLLPEGIETLLGDDRDNTIIAHGSEDAIRDLRGVLKMLDVKPRQIEIRATAILIITDRRGRTQRTELRAQGRTTGDHRLHLKTTLDGEAARLAGAALATQTSDADIDARIVDYNSVAVETDWYVDIAWHTPGAGRPLRLHNVFRTSAVVASGRAVTVTKSSLRLPSGSAELLLQLTPVIVGDRPTSHE